jgi:hypothetical protein
MKTLLPALLLALAIPTLHASPAAPVVPGNGYAVSAVLTRVTGDHRELLNTSTVIAPVGQPVPFGFSRESKTLMGCDPAFPDCNLTHQESISGKVSVMGREGAQLRVEVNLGGDTADVHPRATGQDRSSTGFMFSKPLVLQSGKPEVIQVGHLQDSDIELTLKVSPLPESPVTPVTPVAP